MKYAHIYTFLLVFLGFAACNAPIKKSADATIKTSADTPPKFKKTQGSNPYDNIHSTLQDQAGNLWFGTTGEGVYRYDGKKFTQFTTKDGLNSNIVWVILEDKTGNIWIGTNQGLCRYDGKKITSMAAGTTKNVFTNVENTATKNEVFSILQDKNGILWFGTSEGIYTYNGTIFTPFLANKNIINTDKLTLQSIQCMLQDKYGNIWFGSGPMAFEGLAQYDGTTLSSFKITENSWGSTATKNENWLRNIVQDKTGTLYFVTRHYGVYTYDGKTFTPFASPPNAIKQGLNNIFFDRAGNIWYAYDYGGKIDDEKGGLWRYDGKAFTKFTQESGLRNFAVWTILEDKMGNIWVGTRNTQLYRYDGKTFTCFSE
jgi:ligand-binding sensor domain-containing protein